MAFDLLGLRCYPLPASPVAGYQDYQDPGYKDYDSACSLWNTVLLEKVVLPNPEAYGG